MISDHVNIPDYTASLQISVETPTVLIKALPGSPMVSPGMKFSNLVTCERLNTLFFRYVMFTLSNGK
jgi:hypothetical protein